MQMYDFPGPTPDRTSGLDHDVVLHELTHGTSNRLHNNATGLTSVMAVGMGEGWSDFYARGACSRRRMKTQMEFTRAVAGSHAKAVSRVS